MLHIQLKLDAIDLIVHIDHSIKLVAIDPAFIANQWTPASAGGERNRSLWALAQHTPQFQAHPKKMKMLIEDMCRKTSNNGRWAKENIQRESSPFYLRKF